jgi:hypothetical protein
MSISAVPDGCDDEYESCREDGNSEFVEKLAFLGKFSEETKTIKCFKNK